MKSDPSALYFNPALLPRANGAQVLVNTNFVNLEVEFQRAPLTVDQETRTFEPVYNQAGFFPAPFVAASWDVGSEDLTIGAGLFGPSGYGERCFGEVTDDGCRVDRDHPSRYLLVESSLIEIFASLGAGYRFDLPVGSLSVGATGMATYLDTAFVLAVHGAGPLADSKDEDPENDAIFRASDMSDWAFTGTFGLAYELQGFRLGASYRLPISWEAEGTAELELPEVAAGFGELNDDGVTLQTAQAGTLRVGFGYEGGADPADAQLPRYNLEFNLVWEDWSRVDYFRITPHGALALGDYEKEIDTIYQAKQYEDTLSFRFGGSYAFTEWIAGHAGGYYETGAQPREYTSIDFVSWDRLAGGLGATFRLYDQLEFDIAYQHVFSPQREVSNGQVYNQDPLSNCQGPDYDNPSCDEPGTPPGNPQNNGTWNSSFQTASIGITYRYE